MFSKCVSCVDSVDCIQAYGVLDFLYRPGGGMVDTHDSKSCDASHESSSLSPGTVALVWNQTLEKI